MYCKTQSYCTCYLLTCLYFLSQNTSKITMSSMNAFFKSSLVGTCFSKVYSMIK